MRTARTELAETNAGPRGYTIVELMVAMLLGVIVLTAAVSFLVTQLRALEGSDIQENLTRNGRYVGTLLRHDIQKAGIDIESTPSFGTLAVWPGTVSDTLVVLYVPYEAGTPPPLAIDPDAGTPPPGMGTCGATCIDLLTPAGESANLAPGDLARLQVDSNRRLILVTDVTETSETGVRVEFADMTTLLRQPAGLSGGLQILNPGTFVQKLALIIYFVDDEDRLVRGNRLDEVEGRPHGDAMAYGVEGMDVKLIFADGRELDRADPTDGDDGNDFDDIVGVRIRTTLKADRVDPRVNQGELLRRDYEWHIAPRNLRYEKNRPS